MNKSLPLGILLASVVAAQAQFTVSSVPNNITVNAGSAASFTVAATDATNTITYQWTNASGPIPGATNATYAFDNVSTNQGGVYGVSVVSPDGSTNLSASLTVLQGTLLNVQVTGFASGPSNLLLELFDHDKPATVENFLHYVRSPAYSNLFIDRLLPGFVLQSGDFDATDKTNTTPNQSLTNYISIGSTYVQSTNISPPFPAQLNNEFFAGPIVSNRPGTVAMALPANNANGGNSAFYINLIDNPELDTTQDGGPYVVFGRIIGGTSVLDYFNTNFAKPTLPTNLVFTANIFTNGIFDYVYLNANNQQLTDLPENFDAPNIPANDNLFFLNFSFSNTPPPLDTTPPTVALTSPAPNSVTSNAYPYTITGTASDDVGVALVHGIMTPTNNGQPTSGYATSVTNGNLTNWSLDLGYLNPGRYNLTVYSQDGAGNLSPTATNTNIIVTAVITNGLGTVSWLDASGHSNANAVGSTMDDFANYTLRAHPGPGQLFANWNGPGLLVTSPDVEVFVGPGSVYTATFLPDSIPNSVVFTSPGLNGVVTNGNNLVIQGTISGTATPPLSLSVQLSRYVAASPAYWLALDAPLNTTATNSWSVTETNSLAPSQYAIQVIATDANGKTTIVTNTFTVLTGLGLSVEGPGTASYGKVAKGTIPPVGNYLAANESYSLAAKADKGASFICWSNASGSTLSPNISFTMSQGLTWTAVFISNTIPNTVTITSPKSRAQLASGNNIQLAGTLSSSITATQIVCQIYNNSFAVTGQMLANISDRQWSLTVQSNLVPGANYTLLVTARDSHGRSTVEGLGFGILAKLTVSTAGLVEAPGPLGTVAVKPTAPQSLYTAGSQVLLAANPNPGYLFAYWADNGQTNYYNPIELTMGTNQNIKAYFTTNYYAGVAGTYVGLFYPTNEAITPYTSGYWQFVLGQTGSATLNVIFPNHEFTVTTGPKGHLPANGGATVTTANIDGYYLQLQFFVDLTNGTGSMSGYVYNYDFGTYAELHAYLADTSPGQANVAPSNYVMEIPGNPTNNSNEPEGNGYATYSIDSKGALRMVGALADGTPISQFTGISAKGVWPLYVPLYKSQGLAEGLLIGWQTNSNPASAASTNAGQIATWLRPKKFNSAFTNGFIFNTNTVLAIYQAPSPGSSYTITFGSASLTNPLTHQLAVSPTGTFVPVGTTDTTGFVDKLAITLFSPTTGALAGKFTNPADGATLQFHAAFANPTEGGSGYFLDASGRSGYVTITPAAQPADAQ